MGKAIGKSILEEAKANVKKKQKENTDMKNIKSNQTVKTIVTVIITLLSIAALGAAFLAGMNYQKQVNSDVQSQVKSVVSAIKVEPSKE